MRYDVKRFNLSVYSSSITGAITISSSESNFYRVISWEGNLQGWKHTGSTGFARWIGNESGSTLYGRHAMPFFNCAFPEPSLIWLLPGQEVPWGWSYIPGMISKVSISSRNDVGAGVDRTPCVWGLTTAGTVNSVVAYFYSLSQNKSPTSPHPGCVNSSSFICFFRNLSMHSCAILEIVPITQLGKSSLLSLPSSVSASSSSSRSSSFSELARSLKLSPISFNISWHVLQGILIVNPAYSVFVISSCSWLTAVCASSSRFVFYSGFSVNIILDPFLLRFGSYTAHFSLFLCRRLLLDRKLHNASRAWTLSACKRLLPSFAIWHRHVERFVDLPYLPATGGQNFIVGALTIVVCGDFVVGRDVIIWKIWMIWRQSASFMSRLVHLIKMNSAKSAFWLSLKWGLPYNMTWLWPSVSCNIPRSFLRQTSPDILSLEKFAIDIRQSCHIGCRTPCYTQWNTQTPSDRRTPHCGTVGNRCILQPHATGFIFSRKCKLAVTYSILTWSRLYIPQDFPLLFIIIFLCYSTPANHGYTNTSARWEQIRIKPIDGCFIPCVTQWNTATMQTTVSTLRRCQCSDR